MPNLYITKLSTYRAYAQALATESIDIDDFIWGDEEVAQTRNRSSVASKFLWALPYEEVSYADSGPSDNIIKRKQARMSYLQARNSELFGDEDAQLDACEDVAEQIIARILRDKRGQEIAGVWTLLATRIESFKLRPVEVMLGSTKYIGFEISFEVLDNANTAYNAAKWS